MYETCTFEDAKQLIAALLEENAGMSVTDLATKANLTEAEACMALPEEMVVATDGKHAETILTALPDWGRVTTIINNFGSIFEVKAPFPKGKSMHGYYNLLSREGLNGHLRIDLITNIAFVSKVFHGMDTHHIAFFNKEGGCVFRVYLGRDKARNLLPEQVERYNAMKQVYV
ncbi:heme utilization cystosolic carrier protein HutX [Thaumasiovibrio sp. DFM-14]|uniref:heme utilization cystosolic carrier protein HutX n=1 Tax=Thaumasiovibrio sp. DFM-14 TaxID=3384792 RepID=UPI00399F298E